MPGCSEGGAAQMRYARWFSAWYGQAEAMATLIRRTLLRTWAPILRA